MREDGSLVRIQPAPLLQTLNFRQNMLLNSSRCLTVSSITFILYNRSTLNSCFHFCKGINKLINLVITWWKKNYLKVTRSSSKIWPLDFGKKWCSLRHQWTHVQLSPWCYFTNLHTLKRCLILRVIRKCFLGWVLFTAHNTRDDG